MALRMRKTRRRNRSPQRGRGQTRSKAATSWRLTEDGDIVPLRETYNGKPFFRKEYPWPIERMIANILLANPHPNIVQIYRIGPTYMDMEMLRPFSKKDLDENQMRQAKQHLQKLGIAYMDWKMDNVGMGADGLQKVYDFNMSGIYEVGSNVFKSEPMQGIQWKAATAKGYTRPTNMNNSAFNAFVGSARNTDGGNIKV